MSVQAELIAVGTELSSGQRVDTNSPWLAGRLAELGIETTHQTIVGDVLEDMVHCLRIASERVDVVLVGGGLGPTQDDLTREALAEAAGVALEESSDALRAIEVMFARRGRTMMPRNRVQALVPVGAEQLDNPIGTAPGIRMRLQGADVYCLPGVPSELKRMYDDRVVPRLVESGRTDGVLRHRVIHTFGKGESELEADALDLTVRGRQPEVGITASAGTISFRISARADSIGQADAAIEPTAQIIYQRFAPWIVGEAGSDVPEAAVELLRQTGSTLAVAESCTGGLLAGQLTDFAGISRHFLGGVLAYSNASKVRDLAVDPTLLETQGAVSPEVAAAMARGVRERFDTDLGLSITGIAGPDGGTADKPVGLVYLGLATASGETTHKLLLGEDLPRQSIRTRTVKQALNWLRIHLGQTPIDRVPEAPVLS